MALGNEVWLWIPQFQRHQRFYREGDVLVWRVDLLSEEATYRGARGMGNWLAEGAAQAATDAITPNEAPA